MSRRKFLKTITAGVFALPANSRAQSSCKVLQVTRVTSFQYHEGGALRPNLAVNQTLDLVPEPNNEYDARTVRIDRQGRKLGYIPYEDNAAVSQLLDRSERLEAAIFELKESLNPWERIKVEVRWWG